MSYNLYDISDKSKDRDEGVLFFGPEKCLKEFSITSWIYFAEAISVGSFPSNLDQNCAFELFESGSKLQFDTRSEPKVQFRRNRLVQKFSLAHFQKA